MAIIPGISIVEPNPTLNSKLDLPTEIKGPELESTAQIPKDNTLSGFSYDIFLLHYYFFYHPHLAHLQERISKY